LHKATDRCLFAPRIDSRPDHVSIIVLLDEESEQRMMSWVGEVEAAIVAAGVPIHTSRDQQEPFHTTLGVVNGSSFPMEQALAAIKKLVPYGTWTGGTPLELMQDVSDSGRKYI